MLRGLAVVALVIADVGRSSEEVVQEVVQREPRLSGLTPMGKNLKSERYMPLHVRLRFYGLRLAP